MIDIDDLKSGFRIGEWRVQPRSGTMSRSGRVEHPSRHALSVLLILASYQGRFVSRADLVERVWGNPALGNAPLNRCMHELATAFDDPSYVKNAPSRGYRIGQAVVLEPRTPNGQPQRHRGVIVGATVIALLATVAWLLLA
ncbi:MAG: winged helix-turn-helix domain-containing protein [Pseudomonadota bacterium]